MRGFDQLNLLLLFMFCIILSVLSSNSMIDASERYAGDALNLGVGARPLGMGGSFVSISDDATSTYWNPAGLGGLKGSQLAFMHASLFGLDSYDFVCFTSSLYERGTLGISWIRVGIDDIPITELSKPGFISSSNRPFISGYMKDVENAFLFSYGKRINIPSTLKLQGKTELFLGGNAKFLYNSVSGIQRNALGFGGDFGILWKISFSDSEPKESSMASFGLSIQDFFKTRIIWNTTSSPSHMDVIPPNVKFGLAYSKNVPIVGGKMVVSIDANTRYDLAMHYGIEYLIAELLALRVGINEQSLTAGAGLNIAFPSFSLLIDYAFLSHELGNSHRVSIITKF